MPARVRTLTLRELNRALLARQMLLKRQKLNVVDAVERLACLQGQWAPSPYVALWSRISGFARERLTEPIDRGEIVKATLMRATLHLVTAREYPAYSLATMEGRFGAWRPPGGPALADLETLHRAVMAFAAKNPRTRAEIQDFIADHLPPRFLARCDAAILGHAAPERTRILPETYRKAVIFSAEVWPTFLVDGMVAGRWTIAARPKEAVLELKPFKPLSRAARLELVEEGEGLVRFYAPESKTHAVRA